VTAPRRTQDPTEAARVLDAGGVVLMPTDTLPGLHARLDRPEALARIRTLKGRDADKPLLVLAASAEAAGAWVCWDLDAKAEAAAVWPGPYTLILPAGAQAPPAVTAGGVTLAVRVPADPRLRSLLDVVGAPLASTSANDAGRAPATDLDAAAAWAGGGVDLVADLPWGGAGRPSTLVDLSRRPPRVLRAGAGDPLPGWECVTDGNG